jgi:glycosyltransferase involved in cell wall biosynthesis
MNVNKVFVLPANENWIIDRFVNEWNEDNADISTTDPISAGVIWLLADFCWRHLPIELLKRKKVITSVHHIVPEKFNVVAQQDFQERDQITDVYHVYNQRTFDFIRPLTMKKIVLIEYWANDRIWSKSNLSKEELREKHGIPQYPTYVIGSFQRDTEGHDLASPKLEKGPDLFADYVQKQFEECCDVGMPGVLHVVLAGWRRQYVIKRLKDIGVSYSFFELPDQKTICELYQTLDVYPITARCEGGPQALIECGLLGVKVVSRPIGIAEQVLPPSAINVNVFDAEPTVPNVSSWKLPNGYKHYRELIQSL